MIIQSDPFMKLLETRSTTLSALSLFKYWIAFVTFSGNILTCCQLDSLHNIWSWTDCIIFLNESLLHEFNSVWLCSLKREPISQSLVKLSTTLRSLLVSTFQLSHFVKKNSVTFHHTIHQFFFSELFVPAFYSPHSIVKLCFGFSFIFSNQAIL